MARPQLSKEARMQLWEQMWDMFYNVIMEHNLLDQAEQPETKSE